MRQLPYFLKMTLRSWSRNLLSSTISLVSLIVGLCCSIVLILFALGEQRTARALGDPKQVYLLQKDDDYRPGEHSPSAARIGHKVPIMIADMYPEVEEYARFVSSAYRWGKLAYDPSIHFVSPNVCDFFDIPVLEGNLAQTLSNPNEMAATPSFLKRYFAALGQPEGRHIQGFELQWNRGKRSFDQTPRDFTVTTILDDSRPLPLAYSGLIRVPEENANKRSGWSNGGAVYFLKLNEETDGAGFAARLNADTLFTRHLPQQANQIYLTPLSEHYFADAPKAQWGSDLIVTRSKSLLTISFTVALVILLIACFNYVNITMTRASERLKNIAGQRIMGASAWSVRGQVVLDTALHVLVAFIGVLFLLRLILPVFNDFMAAKLQMSDVWLPGNLAAIVGLMSAIVLLSSAYILTKLETSDPLAIFKSASQSRLTLARTMVIVQFVLSVALIAVSINVSRQMNYMVHARPYTERLLTVSAGTDPFPEEFVNRLTGQAFVDQYTFCPTTLNGTVSESDGTSMNFVDFSAQAADVYGVELVEGRMFGEKEAETNILVNETFVKKFGVEEPIGHTFDLMGRMSTVVGVVKDVMIRSGREAVSPMCYQFRWEWGGTSVTLRCLGNVDEHMETIRALWKEMEPEQLPLTLTTLEQTYLQLNAEDVRLKQIVTTFTVISILLTALGLFGLAWYTAQRRSREIAIRKVFGSSRLQVILMLCRSFLGWVVISIVIALPVAWWLTEEWLSEFVYKVDNSVWVLLITAGIAAAVTFLTVITQSWRAASTNPAVAVKSE